MASVPYMCLYKIFKPLKKLWTLVAYVWKTATNLFLWLN